MTIKNLNPYLMFDGTAEEALKLYERALDAKIEGIQRFGDLGGDKTPTENSARVIHALVRIGAGVLMVSDSRVGEPEPVGGNVQVCLDFDDEADMARKFDALAAGGEVTMALHDTFWGAKFGTLTDRFGVRWMFNCMKNAH